MSSETYRGFLIEEEILAKDHGPLRAGTQAYRVTNTRDNSSFGVYDQLSLAKFVIDLRLGKKQAETGTIEEYLDAVAQLTAAVGALQQARQKTPLAAPAADAEATWRKDAIATVLKLTEEVRKRVGG